MQREIKFRVFDKEAKTMQKVSSIDIENNEVFIYDIGGFDKNLSFDEIELMQFTGLYDKNGVEIYEGDILENKKERNVVFFEDGCFYVKFQDSRYRVGGFDSTFINVIGNIHENPELLK
ncbi:YopX family protein [Capnocytophaga canimorsus]|uniref:YopX family protein n=1 Tax=Capnocytophaga canimorsus TaxID=28188 RepID=UPI0037D3C857